MNLRIAQLVVALLLVAQLGPGAAYADEDASGPPAPEVAASAWALLETESGEYLAGENESRRLPTGSTSKMMTALVALDLMDSGDAKLEDEVTVSRKAASFARPIYSNAGLAAGDVLSIRELLVATLVPSGNDAAYALAEHLGGGSVERYVGRMNRKARELGLEDTRFGNVTGLDARKHYSSARDLAELALAGFRYPLFRETVAMPSATISTQNRTIDLASENDLLFLYPRATGVKTGTTPGAGPSLVASAASGDESYIAVVLGAKEDRYEAAIRLLEHGFAAYDRVDLARKGVRYARADVPYRREEKVTLVAKEDVEWLVDAGSTVERRVSVTNELPDAAEPGTELGELVVEVDGKVVGSTPLVARRGYEKASLWEMLWYATSGLWR